MTELHIPQGYQGELVRGNVKAAMKEAGAVSADLWQAPLEKMRLMPDLNGRIHTPSYLQYVDDLATSIIENGYYQDKPLAGFVTRENGVDVINITEGGSRYLACHRARERGYQIATVPIVIKPRGTDLVDLTIALVKSNEGLPFTTYETALLCKRLIGMGLDEKTIAQRLNYKTGRRYVEDLLNLASVPADIRDLLLEDRVSATLVMDLLRSDPENARKRILAAVDKAQQEGKVKATPKHDKAPEPASYRLVPRSNAMDLLDGVELDDKRRESFIKAYDKLLKKFGMALDA